MSYMKACAEMSLRNKIPIPRAQRVSGCVHLQSAFRPRWIRTRYDLNLTSSDLALLTGTLLGHLRIEPLHNGV